MKITDEMIARGYASRGNVQNFCPNDMERMLTAALTEPLVAVYKVGDWVIVPKHKSWVRDGREEKSCSEQPGGVALLQHVDGTTMWTATGWGASGWWGISFYVRADLIIRMATDDEIASVRNAIIPGARQ